MRALFLGRVLRRERYNVILEYEGKTYTGLVKRKVLEEQNVFVNDRVWFYPINDNEASIERIAGRKNYFERPPVSNLDLIVYVHSFVNPACDIRYLDLTLGLARAQNIESLILFHKADLVDEAMMEPWLNLYKSLGYNTFKTSIYYDLSYLKEFLRGKTVLFTGPSGVGKSSLVKALWNDASTRVGEISKIGRGKHTTTWVELRHEEDTWLVDAPGFALLEVPPFKVGDIQHMFPEIEALSTHCFFSDCLHINEPKCAVKSALKDGRIAPSRYDSYVYLVTKQQEEVKK
jgi:ribosome biogenesis GTPase